MADSDLNEARLAEYRQRRITESLRRQVYARNGPGASPALVADLLAAEKELTRLEQARRSLEPGQAAPLIDTSGRDQKAGGNLMGKDTTGVDAKVELRMSHVPTGVIHLLDKDRTPLVTYCIGYQGRNFARLRLTSYVEGYSARAVDSVEIQTGADPVTINHLPTFFPAALEKVTELTRATLHISIDFLDQTGKIEQQSSFPIWLLARTSAYNGFTDPSTGAWVDLSSYFGAWVTPNAPAIMGLLRQAAEANPQRMFVGYQGTDDSVVDTQVKAVYDTLKAQGIVYINSVLTFGAEEGSYMQRVRLPSEALQTKSANCIDGTVLMASVLEAASLNPALVLVPGHAFLAYQKWDDRDEWDYVETTMIGAYDFETARNYARQEAQQYQTLAQQSNDPSKFQLLSLPILRAQYGVTPME